MIYSGHSTTSAMQHLYNIVGQIKPCDTEIPQKIGPQADLKTQAMILIRQKPHRAERI